MYKDYEPSAPFNIPFQLLKRQIVDVPGVMVEEHIPDFKGFCSCITYSTNDTNFANLQTSQEIWYFETYYTNKIKKGDQIMLLDDGSVYDIVGVPENVRRQNKYLKCKLVRING